MPILLVLITPSLHHTNTCIYTHISARHSYSLISSLFMWVCIITMSSNGIIELFQFTLSLSDLCPSSLSLALCDLPNSLPTALRTLWWWGMFEWIVRFPWNAALILEVTSPQGHHSGKPLQVYNNFTSVWAPSHFFLREREWEAGGCNLLLAQNRRKKELA